MRADTATGGSAVVVAVATAATLLVLYKLITVVTGVVVTCPATAYSADPYIWEAYWSLDGGRKVIWIGILAIVVFHITLLGTYLYYSSKLNNIKKDFETAMAAVKQQAPEADQQQPPLLDNNQEPVAVLEDPFG